MIDLTSVRAQRGRGAQKGDSGEAAKAWEGIERSGGEPSSKIAADCDAQGRPTALLLPGGR